MQASTPRFRDTVEEMTLSSVLADRGLNAIKRPDGKIARHEEDGSPAR